jgi:hypothetical protein
MDFSKGLPETMRTLVVIPTMLTTPKGVEDLLEALEVRFLGNQDPYLHFALLTDLVDAPTETLDNDELLVEQARNGIIALNDKYSNGQNDRFYLIHRRRTWNESEKVWMGYERKRGKLAELNALLRSDSVGDKLPSTSFSMIVGDLTKLVNVKYVITLDTDTQLPRDSAREFIGTMAHPLNHPRFDKTGSRVIGGYGILQPRMAASLSANKRSRYALLYGLEPGIDPYTRSVSDVYQDLFDEGSFIGKGIYDVDAFEQTLRGRFPENRILSHDLLEGCYTRSGLLSDVQLYEENPTSYAADVSRRERWIRGDWQIASWLFKRVPGFNGKSMRNPLSALSRWKILDNLVRSLAPVCLLTSLILGWLVTGEIWYWTSAVFSIVFIPALLIGVVDLFRGANEVSFLQHCTAVIQSVERNLAQSVFRISCLPHEATYSLTAILRSLGRMLITRRSLLEWNPYADQNSKGPASLWATYSSMWVGPVIALATAVALQRMYDGVLLDASPVLLLWVLAPAVAWWISQPLQPEQPKLSSEQVIFLRKISRKTWAFFDRFVGAEDNWLPPDNFQEFPSPVVAHRTSPTNMGLALLANVTAYDFAYIPVSSMLGRIQNTLDTMGRMERYAGHFFNWYETTTLRPLPPRYISSVDSGNLVGHLITLRAALVDLQDHPIVSPNVFEGLLDTLRLLSDAAAGMPSEVVRASIQNSSKRLPVRGSRP